MIPLWSYIPVVQRHHPGPPHHHTQRSLGRAKEMWERKEEEPAKELTGCEFATHILAVSPLLCEKSFHDFFAEHLSSQAGEEKSPLQGCCSIRLICLPCAVCGRSRQLATGGRTRLGTNRKIPIWLSLPSLPFTTHEKILLYMFRFAAGFPRDAA